ncbi:MAG TPA: CBS domain-containing protein [Gammaproteobacteria bacterium]|nr:CBS domain-containing protein [Gammaproteobacteria bacterium]
MVEKTEAVTPPRAVDEDEQQQESPGRRQQAVEAYQSVEQLPQSRAALHAEQIMRSPVVTLAPEASVDEALALFRRRQVRHLPVVSADGQLVGMVSDRDILGHLAGVTENYRRQDPQDGSTPVAGVMKSPVLTASPDTDVRYIARLFVEQRIGALPIVTDGELAGIIARSDVLSAVMRHYVLELWA